MEEDQEVAQEPDISIEDWITLRDRKLAIERKFLSETSFGRDIAVCCRTGEINSPVELIGCPLLKKTRDAADGDLSFCFFVLGFNVGTRDKFECPVVGRSTFFCNERNERDFLFVELFVLAVPSLKDSFCSKLNRTPFSLSGE